MTNLETLDIAVVGATGAVGQAMLEILAARDFPVGEFYPLASARSKGETIDFKGKPYLVEDVAEFDFSKAQLALFSAGSTVSAEFAPIAAAAQCVVIDNTSQFRYDDDVPLVIPELNPEDLVAYRQRHIIANPNCSTIQMLMALKPIYDAVGISRINVATYQSVSGSGKPGINELAKQTRDLLSGQAAVNKVFPSQIAFNVIPHIDDFQDNGYTREEMKMHWETQKILHDPDIMVNATAVRVPVFYGHSEALHVETRDKISAEQVRKLLRKTNGIKLLDKPASQSYPSPIKLGMESDEVYVGRIREDFTHPNGLNLWVVGDNIRKGGALNAIMIAECLIREYY